MGLDECFFAREIHDDVQAIRRFVDREVCEDLNLFSYSKKKQGVIVDNVSDEEGWESVRQSLILNTGTSGIPHITVEEITKAGTLILEHDHDGRDLDLDYAERVLQHIKYLWPEGVKLFTIIEDELWEMD